MKAIYLVGRSYPSQYEQSPETKASVVDTRTRARNSTHPRKNRHTMKRVINNHSNDHRKNRTHGSPGRLSYATHDYSLNALHV
ncbi:hypothetical protein M752DRAFT_101897 [Aspergillus phoenicis ATCC 13157]|uniref:Uncharacterized protein n=1 Tax=Aspergillus phoenicis ATCC 13157 TaxID=1353007 RepID=A0A370PVZ3_ASPPH|nr:hypothetical protein M752DRAFT_101897 [Aspergillus phoenicis ATCC 13157]